MAIEYSTQGKKNVHFVTLYENVERSAYLITEIITLTVIIEADLTG